MQPHELSEALVIAAAAGNVREAAAGLRARFAPLRIVVVDALDMRDETPAASDARHRLFLAASDGHCWSVTADATKAAGLYLAPCP